MNALQDPTVHRSLTQQRRDHLDELRVGGVDPFQCNFSRTHTTAAIRDNYPANANEIVAVAGRVVAWRELGKTTFANIRDASGAIQIAIERNALSDEAAFITKHVQIGDWIGVVGPVFATRTSEISVRLESITMTSKCLQPPPLTWHGLDDEETRYRQRYVHMIADPSVRTLIEKRFIIIQEIRSWLTSRGYLEVETPMLEAVAGGAQAKPFVTHHNALDCDLFLRIAPELRLKRLLVGGFEKIFELNRNFRNEGISRRHNPEFTMLELYETGGTFETMAALIEALICHLAGKFCGSLALEHQWSTDSKAPPRLIDLSRPWRRARYRDLVDEAIPGWFTLSYERKQSTATSLGITLAADLEEYEITQEVFEHLVEAKLFDPTFVTHLPKELVPLAKHNAQDPSVVDVYELIINGQEISPGYSELNDPLIQRERLESQAGTETQKIDEDFLTALSYGMPPAGGLGMGIDRLVMLLTGAANIRDVIAFPTMRPK